MGHLIPGERKLFALDGLDKDLPSRDSDIFKRREDHGKEITLEDAGQHFIRLDAIQVVEACRAAVLSPEFEGLPQAEKWPRSVWFVSTMVESVANQGVGNGG
jgi:hypothetical protein